MASCSIGTLFRQTASLTKKNLVIAVVRRPISTCFRAIILPIAFLTLILEIKYLLSDNSRYGVGSPSPVQALGSGLLANKQLVIVVPTGLGPDVNATVQQIVKPLADVFQQLIYLDNVTNLLTTCRVNIRGNSNCYAAIVFNDSPQTTGGSKT
jgi:ATP-binding cassette subfamily A (ABC1) protein 3